MRKLLSIVCVLVLLFTFAACSDSAETETTTVADETDTTQFSEAEISSDILIVNFSCTGNTKRIAEKAADYLDADLYEIIPEIPYNDDDLNYSDQSCRANIEQANDKARPEISGQSLELSKYDTVVISFPIWWGKEPRIIDTFMEEYDFTGKKLACFCTSGSSGISQAEENLHAYTQDNEWFGAIRFAQDATDKEITDGLASLGLSPSEKKETEKTDMIAKINVAVGDYTFTATLEDNEAAHELLEMIKEKPLTLNLSDYSGFEKVGSLGRSLTRSDRHTTTKSGDIVLYNGNNIVVFYGSNSWSYTRLGRIDSLENWEKALGSGDVIITLSI